MNMIYYRSQSLRRKKVRMLIKYDRLKTIKQNPKKVMLEDIETGEIKNLSIDLQSGKIYRSGPLDDYLLGWWSLEK